MKTIKIFLIFIFFVSINFTDTYAQRNIKGRIIEESLDELIAVKVFDFNNNLLGETDFNGFFDVIIPNESNWLKLAYIGLEIANIKLSDSCNYVEIILLPDTHYDFMSSQKIDRLRKKEFDKLSQLHLEAIKKGIFKNEMICYSREFEAKKPRLDEIGKQMKITERQIKKDYQNLSVGDTIKIPFSGNKRYNGTDKTTLFTWSSLTDTKNFDCVIEGVVVKKYQYKNGYNFTYKVTDCEKCKFDSIVYNGKAMKIGQEFEHDMKIFKTIISQK